MAKPDPAVTSAHADLQRFGYGISKLASLLRPSLGPTPRVVMNGGPNPLSRPEILESGGDIARRMVQLDNRIEDAGAMFLRGMLWNLHESMGDGVTTASILFESIYMGGRRAIDAGANGVGLRHYLNLHIKTITDELDMQSVDLASSDGLFRFVQSVCPHPELAERLCILFGNLGLHSLVEIRSGVGREITILPTDGPFWSAPILDSAMIQEQAGQRTELQRCAILVSDLDLSTAEDIAAIIAASSGAENSSLLIIARSLSKVALATIMLNRSISFPILAVRFPNAKPAQEDEILKDVATLVGGRLLLRAAGDSATNIRPDCLGSSRNAWVSRTHFGFVSPSGSGRGIRDRIDALLERWRLSTDMNERSGLSSRIATLTSRSAVLQIGGHNQSDVDRLKHLAERTARSIRTAMAEGVVPGGGAALLSCRTRLMELAQGARDIEERMSLYILVSAMEAPSRALAANAGLDSSYAIAAADFAGSGFAMDVIHGTIVDMAAAGMFDSHACISAAVQHSVESAGRALTVETLVLHRFPAIASSP